MSDHQDTIWGAITKAILWAAAWFGTIKLADVQVVVSIVSGLCIGGLAALNLYVTWRDKVRK